LRVDLAHARKQIKTLQGSGTNEVERRRAVEIELRDCKVTLTMLERMLGELTDRCTCGALEVPNPDVRPDQLEVPRCDVPDLGKIVRQARRCV
jgi:hypothetical protein